MLSSELESPTLVSTITGVAAVVGPPSPLMAWVCCLLHHVERVSNGAVAVAELSRNADFRPLGNERRIFVGHDSPSVEAAAMRHEFAILAVIDELPISVEFMCAGGTPFIDVLRVHSAALVFAPALRDNPLARVLGRNAQSDARSVVRDLCRHIGVRLSLGAEKEIFGWLAIDTDGDPSLPQALASFCAGYGIPEPNPSNLTESQRLCIRNALAPMLRLMGAPPWQPIVWPIDMMFVPGEGEQPVESVLDLAGPPRCLLYGPYIHLPRSRYEVQFVFGLTGVVHDMNFAIELIDDDCRSRALVKPDSEGIFRGRFYHEQTRSELRLAVRLLNEDSAIDGHIGFSSVSFIPLETP